MRDVGNMIKVCDISFLNGIRNFCNSLKLTSLALSLTMCIVMVLPS